MRSLKSTFAALCALLVLNFLLSGQEAFAMEVFELELASLKDDEAGALGKLHTCLADDTMGSEHCVQSAMTFYSVREYRFLMQTLSGEVPGRDRLSEQAFNESLAFIGREREAAVIENRPTLERADPIRVTQWFLGHRSVSQLYSRAIADLALRGERYPFAQLASKLLQARTCHRAGSSECKVPSLPTPGPY